MNAQNIIDSCENFEVKKKGVRHEYIIAGFIEDVIKEYKRQELLR